MACIVITAQMTLISSLWTFPNASDALDKIRDEPTSGPDKIEAEPDFFSKLIPDITNSTIMLDDSSTGMTCWSSSTLGNDCKGFRA